MDLRTTAPIYDGLLHYSDLSFPTSSLRTRALELLSALNSPQDSGLRVSLRIHITVLLCAVHQLPYLLLKEPSSYTGLMTLWRGLFWLRPDYIALQLGLAMELLYAVWAGIGLLTALLAAAMTGNSPRAVQSLRTGMDLIVTCPVPILGILLGHLVGSAEDPLAVSTAWELRGVSALCLCLLCGFYSLHSFRTAELPCSPTLWTGLQHCSPSQTAVDLGQMSASALLRYLLSPYSALLLYLLSALLHLSVFLFFALRQPLFSSGACEGRAGGALWLGWTGLALALGYLVDSELAGLLLSVLVGAGLIGVLHCCWPQIHSSVLSKSLQNAAQTHTRGAVLLAIRALLLPGLSHPDRLKGFRSLRQGQRSLLAAVESAYSLQIMGNETLARFQLSAKDKNCTFLDDLLAYRVQKRLNCGENANSYLNRLCLFAQIHHLDSSLCPILARF